MPYLNFNLFGTIPKPIDSHILILASILEKHSDSFLLSFRASASVNARAPIKDLFILASPKPMITILYSLALLQQYCILGTEYVCETRQLAITSRYLHFQPSLLAVVPECACLVPPFGPPTLANLGIRLSSRLFCCDILRRHRISSRAVAIYCL